MSLEMLKEQITQYCQPANLEAEALANIIDAGEKAAMDKGKLWDMTDEEYFGFPGINASSLADVRRSPLHYYDKHILGNKSYSSKAMDFGSLVHAAVLQPEKVHTNFVNNQEFIEAVMKETPDSKKPTATKLYKELVAKAVKSGKTVVDDADFTGMNNILEKVYSHPTAKNMLSNGHAEKVLFAEDPGTGLLLKCKADWILSDGYIIDLKTTRDASYNHFQRSMYNFNYYVQAAFYLHIARNSLGAAFKNFLFICVESTAPHGIAIYRADEAALDAGERVFKRDLRILKECYQSGKWPGYKGTVQNLALPPYAFNQLEDFIDG